MRKGNTFIPFIILLVLLGLATTISLKFPRKKINLAPQNPINKIANTEYSYKWDKSKSKLELTKNKASLLSIYLPEKPLGVWVYPDKEIVATVTLSSNTTQSTQNLYLSSVNKTVKIYTGVRYTVPYGKELKSYSEEIEIVGFSPDGVNMLFTTSRWDDTVSFVSSIENELKPPGKDKASPFPFGRVFWNPNSHCALNVNGPGMYGPHFSLLDTRNEVRFIDLSNTQDDLQNDFDQEKTQVLWKNNCSGIVRLEPDKYAPPGTKQSYYNFDSEKGQFNKTDNPTEIFSYKNSVVSAGIEVATDPEFSVYESKKLGVSFKHDNRLTVTETKNRISINDDPNTKLPHYYIEVFSKKPQDALEQAINSILLADYKRSECYAVQIQSGYPSRDGYVLAEVIFPPNKNPQDENNYPNCNPDYFNTSTPRVFWMDPSRPEKFVFISAGQSVMFSTGDIDWQSFKFTPIGTVVQ